MEIETKKTKRTSVAVVWRGTVYDDDGNKTGTFLARKDTGRPEGEYQMASYGDDVSEEIEEAFETFKEEFQEETAELELLTTEAM